MLQYLGHDATFIMYMNSLPFGFLLKNKRQDLKMNECMESGKHRVQLNANGMSLFPCFVLNIVTLAYNVCSFIRRNNNKNRSLVGRGYYYEPVLLVAEILVAEIYCLFHRYIKLGRNYSSTESLCIANSSLCSASLLQMEEKEILDSCSLQVG